MEMLRKVILVMGTVITMAMVCGLDLAEAAERAVQLQIPGCHT